VIISIIKGWKNQYTKLDGAGFGVVEIVITIMVVGILSGGLYSVTISSANITDQASDVGYVNSLAQNKIEGLRSIGFPGLSDGTVDFSDELPTTLGNPKSASYTISSADVNLKLVILTITIDQLGESESYEFATYIGELGVGQ